METFTTKEMEKCFEAGVKFARDMFNNPSNSEYIEIVKEDKKLNASNDFK